MPEEPSSDTNTRRLAPNRGGKPSLVLVNLLDGNILDVDVERKSKGEKVFEDVCKHLDLAEKDYFGLSFRDKSGRRNWLDLDKRIGKVLKGSEPWKLDFEVKFYPKDPSQLQEDFTRYLLCLQVRNDILSGKLPCSFVTYAVLGSYLVQSQLGDFSPEDYTDSSYLSGFKFCPDQTSPALIEKVMSLHKDLKGQRPAEAECQYLNNAKKLSLYGVDMHPAKDSEGVDLQLGVCSTGILVYQDLLRINRFAWPKILKISYRRNNFYIKIRPGEFEQYEQTVGFKLDNSRSAKNLWKVCVDQHTFFRLMTADAIKRPYAIFPRIGSLYRWNRKTQAEVLDTTLNAKNSQHFQRSHSYGPSRSFDTLAPQQQQQEPTTADESTKRHTMSHAPARPMHGSPAKFDKKPAGGVAVLPPLEQHRKKKGDKDKERENGTNGLSSADHGDDEKENHLRGIDDSSTPVKDEQLTSEKKKQSPAHGFITIFANTKDKKSPKSKDSGQQGQVGSVKKDKEREKEKDKKKKEGKSKSKEKIALAESVQGVEEYKDSDNKQKKQNDSGFGSLMKLGIGKDKTEDDKKRSKDKDSKSKTTKEQEAGVDDKMSVFKTDKKDKKSSKKDKKSLDNSETSTGNQNDRSLNDTETSPYTKVYEYIADDDSSNKRKPVSGFSYETDKAQTSKQQDEQSPGSPARKETGVAFNYAPGELNSKNVSDDGTTSKSIFGKFFNKSGDNKKSPTKSSESTPDKDAIMTSTTTTGAETPSGDPAKSKKSKSSSKNKKDKDSLTKKEKDSLTKKEKDSLTKKEKDTLARKERTDEIKADTAAFLEHEKEYSPQTATTTTSTNEEEQKGPKIIKTTTKSSIVNTGGTITQNVEEKIEDVSTGEVTHSTLVNRAEGLDDSKPTVRATAVTTRTATTLEDLGTNAKTSQVEEKTVARSTTTTGLRQEERVVTQEVRATTVVNEPQIGRAESTSSLSSDDSGTPIDFEAGTYYTDKPQGPIVETEPVIYSPIVEGDELKANQTPLVHTVSHRLEDGTFALPGAVVTSQTITSKKRTVETVTYQTEKDGVVETRVEQKITIQSDGDPIDHDKALTEAIQEATAMNPDMRVEKIEIQQESLP